MTVAEFYERILELLKDKPKRSLEDYLLALHGILEKQSSVPVDVNQVFNFLAEAFYAPSIPFPDSWSMHTNAPRFTYSNQSHENYGHDEKVEIEKSFASAYFQRQYTMQVIRFQAAELHAMRGKQLENDLRYFGLDSETGHRWYNFDPFTNLECGARCLLDGAEDGDELEVEESFLGTLLEMGRSYE